MFFGRDVGEPLLKIIGRKIEKPGQKRKVN